MSQSYLDLLPIQERVFDTSKGKWKAKVINTPGEPPFQGNNDQVCFLLEFDGLSIRNLKLYVIKQLLEPSLNPLPSEILEAVKTWLEEDQDDGILKLRADANGNIEKF